MTPHAPQSGWLRACDCHLQPQPRAGDLPDPNCKKCDGLGEIYSRGKATIAFYALLFTLASADVVMCYRLGAGEGARIFLRHPGPTPGYGVGEHALLDGHAANGGRP